MTETTTGPAPAIPAETLYRVLIDELRFAKRQQWMVSNYVLVLMAALFGVARLASVMIVGKFVLWVLVLAVVGFGLALLVHLQAYLHTTRECLEHLEEQTFGEDQWRPTRLTLAVITWIETFDEWLRDRWKPFEFFGAVLCGVVLVAGFVTLWAIAVV
jgi:hypothetical protein